MSELLWVVQGVHHRAWAGWILEVKQPLQCRWTCAWFWLDVSWALSQESKARAIWSLRGWAETHKNRMNTCLNLLHFQVCHFDAAGDQQKSWGMSPWSSVGTWPKVMRSGWDQRCIEASGHLSEAGEALGRQGKPTHPQCCVSCSGACPFTSSPRVNMAASSFPPSRSHAGFSCGCS